MPTEELKPVAWQYLHIDERAEPKEMWLNTEMYRGKLCVDKRPLFAHPAPTAADTPYDPTTQPYDEPFRHVAADTGLVERLMAENRVLSAELNDACETGRERRDLAYIERKRAEAAEQQLAAAREQRAEFEEHWAALFDTKKAELAAAREQIAELERPNSTQREEWLAAQATLDRNRVLVLEKRLAELEAKPAAADTGGLSAGFIDDGSLESTAVRAAVAGNHAADTGGLAAARDGDRLVNAERDAHIETAKQGVALALQLRASLSSAHETIRAKDEALRDVRPIITSLIARGYNVDTWKLNRVLENIDAALTPLPEGGQ